MVIIRIKRLFQNQLLLVVVIIVILLYIILFSKSPPNLDTKTIEAICSNKGGVDYYTYEPDYEDLDTVDLYVICKYGGRYKFASLDDKAITNIKDY